MERSSKKFPVLPLIKDRIMIIENDGIVYFCIINDQEKDADITVLPSIFFMALAMNRVDFLKSFEDALVDLAVKEFSQEDLEFLFWYRAINCQIERTGYLKEFINLDTDIIPVENGVFEIFCDLTNVKKKGIKLGTIECEINKFCEDMAKGTNNFSKVR